MNTPQAFGPYELIKLIASGGVADVFLAKTQSSTGSEKLLALKMIHEISSKDEELIEALILEARISTLLNHENIVQIFDLAQHENRYYISMEFIDGHDLSLVIARAQETQTPLPLPLVAYIVSRACRALDFAHQQRDESGIPLELVHRDVSPQNILMGYDGQVKLADFGIAKSAVQKSNTLAGIIKGKFAYMSPEQAWGDVLDGRSDIYSLGAVLFELLTGRLLFDGANHFTVIKAVRNGEVSSPRILRPDLPFDLEAITMHALERDREERFQSAGEMGKELERYLSRYHPLMGQGDLSTYIRRLFQEESIDLNQTLINMNESTLLGDMGVPSPDAFMVRDDYRRNDDSSLVFSLQEMQNVEHLSPGFFSQAPSPHFQPPVPPSFEDDLFTMEQNFEYDEHVLEEPSESFDEDPTVTLPLGGGVNFYPSASGASSSSGGPFQGNPSALYGEPEDDFEDAPTKAFSIQPADPALLRSLAGLPGVPQPKAPPPMPPKSEPIIPEAPSPIIYPSPFSQAERAKTTPWMPTFDAKAHAQRSAPVASKPQRPGMPKFQVPSNLPSWLIPSLITATLLLSVLIIILVIKP